jgi:hypothetical protein
MDALEYAEFHPIINQSEVERILADHGLLDSGMNWIDDEHEQDSVWQIGHKIDGDWFWNTDEFMGWLGY